MLENTQRQEDGGNPVVSAIPNICEARQKVSYSTR